MLWKSRENMKKEQRIHSFLVFDRDKNYLGYDMKAKCNCVIVIDVS